jgi:hypothetical protein
LQSACNCLLLTCSLLLDSLVSLILLKSAYVAFTTMLVILFTYKAAMSKSLDLAFFFLLAIIILTKLKVCKNKQD